MFYCTVKLALPDMATLRSTTRKDRKDKELLNVRLVSCVGEFRRGNASRSLHNLQHAYSSKRCKCYDRFSFPVASFLFLNHLHLRRGYFLAIKSHKILPRVTGKRKKKLGLL